MLGNLSKFSEAWAPATQTGRIGSSRNVAVALSFKVIQVLLMHSWAESHYLIPLFNNIYYSPAMYQALANQSERQVHTW